MNPNDAQLRAQSELQSGESLYWTGVADPRRAALAALPATIFGIPFAGFAFFWASQAYHATSSLTRQSNNAFAKGFAVFPVFGLPFLFVGLGIVLAPLWAFLKGGNTVYAVTNQRVMVITGSGTRSVKSIVPADIVSVDHRERPDGSGDIAILTTGTIRTNNSASQVKVALVGIPNVKQVAQQVLALHSQRSAG
ncbi:MAG TPA: PH domain-containing protein [Candidatus Acidoferrum sp.]|nr:PH domain-containing protein [Candidatus Acidoferrum sp.]